MKRKNKIRFVDWSYGFGPDLESVNRMQRTMFNGKEVPQIIHIDTGTDMIGIVISAGSLTRKQAQDAWDEHMYRLMQADMRQEKRRQN